VTGQTGDVRLEVNRWVFGCFLKVFRVLQCRTSGGELFRISGAEYENACLKLSSIKMIREIVVSH